MLIDIFLIVRFRFPSMKKNEVKYNSYIGKLYEGEKKRADSGERRKEERISPEDAQGKEIVRKYSAKCDVCGLPYVDPAQFDIHHINGDPSSTVTRNLVLLCKNCHGSVHGRVNSLIKDYKNEKKETSSGRRSVSKKKTKPKTIKIDCRFCNGRGKGLTGLYLCPVCDGDGQIEVFNPPEKCRPCNGTGKNLSGTMMCQKCGGTGYTNTVKKT